MLMAIITSSGGVVVTFKGGVILETKIKVTVSSKQNKEKYNTTKPI